MTDICVLATVIGEIQRATRDIIGRVYGRGVSSKEVLDQISTW